MYLYETHLHTSPTSACARVGVRETLEFYKAAGFAGVCMTEHFLDGNIAYALRELPYEERIHAYFSAYQEGRVIGEELGLSVFLGIEMSHGGTDFLVYGIDEAWCLAHPDMDKMRKSELLSLLLSDGALIIQAHPFREASYIDHIRLYPRHVHGVEVFNACRTEFENAQAAQYCQSYELIPFAGTDNHIGAAKAVLGGMATEEPLGDVSAFMEAVLSGKARPFIKDEAGVRYL
jgi:histidinol phosphatase-like PHP family hydrolase